MRLSRSAGIVMMVAFLLAMAAGTPAVASTPAAQTPAPPPPPLLPGQFGGWQMRGSVETNQNAAAADPTNAAALKEYRFTDFAAATYVRDDGRTLKIRAARFADASGAFGAYTFYLQPEMAKEQIGDQGASLLAGEGHRVLFYRGQVLVDAVFSKPTAMSGAELRELAGALPQAPGGAGALPPVLEFLPRRGYIANTQKYAEGPAALAALAPPVSADMVDFGASAEVTLGRYHTPSGEALLMLIYYTNPQVAIEHLRRVDPAHPPARAQTGVSTIGNAGSFFYKRTGPIIAIAAGPASERDTKSLLEAVNYEASVTWNQATDNRDVHDLYLLVLNVVILCAVLGGLAIVAGVAFGGFRILMKRWFPDRVFDRPEQMEFISLHLADTVAPAGSPGGGSEPEGRQKPS
ncbi:MAG TPA: DUF6599 family protein [Candidatus Sulfotelmatobacter sp.]|nr:DUF6599 family protein [Candidatus Sulfotelmatobacter sp.]